MQPPCLLLLGPSRNYFGMIIKRTAELQGPPELEGEDSSLKADLMFWEVKDARWA